LEQNAAGIRLEPQGDDRMSTLEEWQQSNNRQLSEALAKLRQRLECYIGEQTESAPNTPAASSGESENLSAPPNELPSALAILGERLHLSVFEQEILLLCAAMELDTRMAGLYAQAQDDPGKPFPTFALALTLFSDASWDALSPERPLRYWRLIEISQADGGPLTASPLRADERIVNYIKGLNYLDERVSAFLAPLEIEPESAELAPSQQVMADRLLADFSRLNDGLWPVVQLAGADEIAKQLVAHQVATRMNRILCRLPAEVLPPAIHDLETLTRLWQRESRLLPLALYADAEQSDSSTGSRPSVPLLRFLGRTEGLCFAAAPEAWPRVGRDFLVLDIARPTAAEQRSIWTSELAADAPESPAQLAAQFNFNLPALRQLAGRARAENEITSGSLPEQIWALCRERERPRLDALAQRLEPKATWDDLVVAPQQMKLLREIAAQVRQRNTVYGDWGFARKMNRGFGITALFAGDSGCGKTMAAEVIANELRLNLYRIDLSAVVNKYIGETEKNLRRLFDAAEAGGSILFFDEADALFGKRSEVKDSHDRYANIETNYLLQRLESYRGLAILATNLKKALDPAFLRRIRFVIDFPFPGVADRRRLWEKVFLQDDVAQGHSGPPLEDLDYARLSRLNLTGGHIHNVALNACFGAAEGRSSVTMPLVLAAARAEFLKLERPISESELRWNETTTSSASPEKRNGTHVLA
jgi:ATP-dependent 26S proteasome regulatory subunit